MSTPEPDGAHMMNLRRLASDYEILARYYRKHGADEAATICQKRSVLWQGKAIAEEMRLRDAQEAKQASTPAARRTRARHG